jgi:hypothetical protein
MDMLNAMLEHLVCLPGAVGLEGVNPTCVEWGFPTTGYFMQFAALPWLIGIAGLIFGTSIGGWFVVSVLGRFGPNLIGRR